MANPLAQLHVAITAGDAVALEAALAAGASPNSMFPGIIDVTALHKACIRGNLACVRALLAAGADPNIASFYGITPLHGAARHGHTQCIRALLGCPGAYCAEDRAWQEALALALTHEHFAAACCLLEQGTLPPAAEVLALLEEARQRRPEALLPLYAPLVAREPLTRAEWARVPTPCPGIGASLPAVLARSEAEAALLVARLPDADRERLRTAALCLKRVERRRRLSLPAELLRPLLLAAME